MKAPEKIYMPKELLSEEWTRLIEGEDVEYVHTDAFIEKAVEWIKEKWDDNYTMPIIIDSVIKEFKNHMKGE